MKRKNIYITIVSVFLILIIFIVGKYTVNYLRRESADTSWIEDMGYQENEIYTLKLDSMGCPLIPITFGSNEEYFILDTGCSTGFTTTTVLKDKIDYTVVDKVEQLNRDGSHRGWSDVIHIDHTVSILGKEYNNITCGMADWQMFSSEKFNGLLGLTYFKDRIITFDYLAEKIGVSSTPIAYSKLDSDKYTVIPLLKTTKKGQEDLIFFEAELDGQKVVVYLDTGKNTSYVHRNESSYIPGSSPNKRPDTIQKDISLMIGSITIPMKNVYVAKLAQGYELESPVAVEINSDQWNKNNIVFTIDLISQNIIFYKR